jgi:hypothetical protein
MYLEGCKGRLNIDWKFERLLSFWCFHEKHSGQMLQYKPAKWPAEQVYPGDKNTSPSMQQNSKQHETSDECQQHGCPATAHTPDKVPIGWVMNEQFMLQFRQYVAY